MQYLSPTGDLLHTCKVAIIYYEWLDKIILLRRIKLNSYFDCENQRKDRERLHTVLCYIESADLLSGKKIIFNERNFETCIFHIEKKVKVKNNG